MTRATLKIDGMSCKHCIMAVREELLKLEPKGLILDDVQIGSAKVQYDVKLVSRTDIDHAVKEAGYNITSWSTN